MNVLCIGEMLYDCIEEPLLDDTLLEKPAFARYVGGAPANVAIGLRKLKVASALLGTLSRDDSGKALLAVLRLAGVDHSYVDFAADAPTRMVRTRLNAGDREFVDFFGGEVDSFADARLKLPPDPAAMLEKYPCIVIGSLLCAYENTRLALFALIRIALKQKTAIIYDINRRPMFWPAGTLQEQRRFSGELAHYATVLKATMAEAQWLFHTTEPAAIMHEFQQLQAVIITDGAEPIRYKLGNWAGELLPPQVAIVDTTGAGDAFTAALTAQFGAREGFSHLSETEARDCVRYAAAAGALSTMQAGALNGLGNDYEIQKFLEHQP